jgi:UMF1 family MFS transporter
LTAIVVALGSPVLGALADSGNLRKNFVVGSTVVAAVATAALYYVMPGQVFVALALVVVANIAFEFGIVFYNAYLPDVSTPASIGRVSGWGWGFGYFGGLLALVVALLGFIQADPPWFGFATEGGENVRATNLLVAVWFLVFSLPLFFWVRESKPEIAKGPSVARQAFKQLIGTLREVRRHRQTAKFLLARLVYNDGLVTIFAFGGIYAAETFGFTLEEVLVFGIVINLAAGAGAIAMGYVDDLIGAKRTIEISLWGLIGATLIAVFANDKVWLWVAGILIGIFSGPNQSSSRSLMGRLAPENMRSEFFGFFAFSGKLTAFIGPLLLGLATQFSGSQRAGVSVVLLLFVIGLMLLATVALPHARSVDS